MLTARSILSSRSSNANSTSMIGAGVVGAGDGELGEIARAKLGASVGDQPQDAVAVVRSLLRQATYGCAGQARPKGASSGNWITTASKGPFETTSVVWPLPVVSSMSQASPALIVTASPTPGVTRTLPARQKRI